MAVGPNRPEKFLRTKPIRKCAETHLVPCSGIQTVECCKIVPCSYCLKFEVYGAIDQTGTATLDKDTGIWSGTIDGQSWVAWWEKVYDVCQFVVTLNGYEIYRQTCGGYGPSCRDSSDSIEVTIGYNTGTLSWAKKEPRPLPYVVPEGECKTWFCGDCECTCECLCVTVTLEDGTGCKGELCVGEYDNKCEGPVWEGSIACGDEVFDLSLALGRDEYGGCVISGTSGYDVLEPVSVSDCNAIAASWMIGYTTLEVKCKGCDCETVEVHPPCCDRTDIPDVLTLTVTDLVNCTCNDWLGVTVSLRRDALAQGAGLSRWAGCIAHGPCGVISGVGTTQNFIFFLECTEGAIGQGGNPSDLLLYVTGIPGDGDPDCPTDLNGINYQDVTVPVEGPRIPPSTCNPLILVYRFVNEFGARCQDPMSPPGIPEWEFTITE